MNRSAVFAYPGDLNLPTGGYGYDRRLIAGLSDLGWRIETVSLGPGFPHPDTEPRKAAEAILDRLDDGSLVIIDGLAYGILEHWAARQADRLTIVALVHHPLAMETGLDPEERQRLIDSETAALSQAASVIVTSSATASLVRDEYGVPGKKILVALPGVDPAPLARGTHQPPHILSVGSLTRRKGHDILLSALAKVADLPWTCRIVGSDRLDPLVSSQLSRQLSASPIHDRVVLVGEVEDVRSEFAKADIFALATRYEGYGMVFAEALAHGLPIVGCAVGAVPDVVPASAGLLVSPDDPDEFAAALRSVLENENIRSRMADASAIEGAKLPIWRDTASLVSSFLETRHFPETPHGL